MTITDDELLGILDQVTSTLGRILLSYRQLMEGFFEDNVEQARSVIEKKRAEIQKMMDRIKNDRDAIRHRKELDQIRRKNQEKAKTQVESASGGNLFPVYGRGGEVIAYLKRETNRLIVLKPNGQIVARFRNPTHAMGLFERKNPAESIRTAMAGY